jgi:5'-deoxynucleotidase YfbR-like HD superfamily hydrolase
MLLRWRRLGRDLRTGWAVVRRGSAEAVNRSLEEIELVRLKLKLDVVEAHIKELYRAVGERAFQLIEREAGTVMSDKELLRLFDQIEQLKQEEERIQFEMEQVRD